MSVSHPEALKKALIVGGVLLVLNLPIGMIAMPILFSFSLLTILLWPAALLLTFLSMVWLLPLVGGFATYVLLRDGKSMWYLALGALIWPLVWGWFLENRKKKGGGVVVDGQSDPNNKLPSHKVIRELVRDPSGEETGPYFLSSLGKRFFSRIYKDNIDAATQVVQSEQLFFDADERHNRSAEKFVIRQQLRQGMSEQEWRDKLEFERQREQLERTAEMKQLEERAGITEKTKPEMLETSEAPSPAQQLEKKVIALAELEKTKKELLEKYPDMADEIEAKAELERNNLALDDFIKDKS